jgi:hypothetical protein
MDMTQEEEREFYRNERERKKAEDIENAERDAPIRIKFHAWLVKEGFKNFEIPKTGNSYPGSHVQTMWEAFRDGALSER